MTYQELVKLNYPNCILPRVKMITESFGSKVFTIPYTREYDCMSLQLLLGNNSFVTNWDSVSIREKLNDIYNGYTYEYFVSSNLLSPSEVSINDLRFYQDEINLDNLDKIGTNTDYLEEPVLIVKDGSQLILYNGYHRTTINILNNKTTVNGFIIDIK
jgi:hypothetical protein